MIQEEFLSFSKLFVFQAVFVAVLVCLFCTEVHAQAEAAVCPCFSFDEVESIFLRAEQHAADEGKSNCNAADYSVEFQAEISILDQDYATIARASVAWYDYDPGRCAYIDQVGNPGVERNVRWPNPAPEDTARACLNIILAAIAKSDTSGRCTTYP